METTTAAWILRIIIIAAGVFATIRLNSVINLLRKKHKRLYKRLGEPGIFTWSFKKGFIAMTNLETKIIFKDKKLPKDVHKLAAPVRLILGLFLILLIILLLTAATMIYKVIV